MQFLIFVYDSRVVVFLFKISVTSKFFYDATFPLETASTKKRVSWLEDQTIWSFCSRENTEQSEKTSLSRATVDIVIQFQGPQCGHYNTQPRVLALECRFLHRTVEQ
jgi:hypothetical protein